MQNVLRPADAASTLSLLSELLRVGRLAVVAGHDVPLVRVGFGARTYTLRFGVRWNAAQGSYAKTSIERQPAVYWRLPEQERQLLEEVFDSSLQLDPQSFQGEVSDSQVPRLPPAAHAARA